MKTQEIFDSLWKQYTKSTPSAQKIKDLFTKKGDTVYNDHIAFRTFNDPRVNIAVLAKPFIAAGYVEKGEYHFEKKKLYAKHFEHNTNPDAPKVFISELLVEEFSKKTQDTIAACLDKMPLKDVDIMDMLVLQGRLWGTPSFATYQELQQESEYAAWLYVNGFCANHFTIDVNKLDSFDSLTAVNTYLKENGYVLNNSGGEIKGSAAQFLEQSSILADTQKVTFIEGEKQITSCYYEFAYRHAMPNQELYRGFIAGSADKIFESTDMKLRK